MADRKIAIHLVAIDEASKVLERAARNTLPALAKAAAQAVASFASFRAVESLVRGAVDAALEAEKATKGLAAALHAQGATAIDALPGLKAHAEALSRVSLADDEAIQGAQKLLVSIGGLLGPKLDEATKAALDLSAGLGIDLEQAATMVAKAAQGSTKEFSRLGFEFQKNATDAQKLDTVLAGVQSRFGGMAEAEIKTASGQIHELNEAFHELLETMGTKLVGGGQGISALTSALQDLNDQANNKGTIGFFESLVLLLGAPLTGGAILTADLALAAEKARLLGENMAEDRLENPMIGYKDAVLQARKGLAESAAWTEELAKRTEVAAAAAAKYAAWLKTTAAIPTALPFPKSSGSQPFDSGTVDQGALQGQISETELQARIDLLDAAGKSQEEQWAIVLAKIVAAQGGLIQFGETIKLVDKKTASLAVSMEAAIGDAMKTAALELGTTLVEAAFGADVAWGETIKNIIKQLLIAIVQALIMKAITSAISAGSGGGMQAGGVVGGAINIFSGSRGGLVPKYAAGGMFARGTDTVPAMLTPGEMVIPRAATQSILGGRAALVEAGGVGRTVVNVYALDSHSFDRALMRNSASVERVLDYIDSRNGI